MAYILCIHGLKLRMTTYLKIYLSNCVPFYCKQLSAFDKVPGMQQG